MNAAAGKNYLNWETGLWSWLTTVDHKRIGLMYLYSILIFFFIAGCAALMIRIELSSPGATIVDASWYNVLFTLHGAIMVFLLLSREYQPLSETSLFRS